MLLAVDVGNSNIVLGGYDCQSRPAKAGGPCFLARLATDRFMEADQYAVQIGAILDLHQVRDEPIDKVMFSSVVPSLNAALLTALAFFTKAKPHILSLADAGRVQVAINNPAELGMDILASAIAVAASRPLPAVIIDMGTATKLTALDGEGRLLGVAISPGLFVSLEALVSHASLLQGIQLNAPPSAIGKNSLHSMQSGVVLGTAAMLDGMIDRFDAEMGGIKTVVATGGGAGVVVPHCKRTIEISETLLLDGLYQAAQ